MRDGYVIAGWVLALAGIGMYAYRTVIRTRQVAAQLLAIESSTGDDRSAGSAGPLGDA